ncbi:MAG: transketolase [Clostridia bacterium]|nr:transketolase [Clostridia bacterium]
MNTTEKLTIDAIRILSAEAIQKAKSGHPGLPLGTAPIGYELYANQMVYNPKNPDFFNRDRFVLSAGHGSMLVYSLLHLFGFGLTKEDLMSFRQFGSLTPGHPEYHHTKGVDTSTGPLGQGIANAVGMAMAEAYLSAKFNKEGFPIVDHYTYALCGDGCMMEGIEAEAASLAGTLGLGKLIVFYDDNDITIEGDTDIAFRENVGKRHEAQGWQVINVADANDLEAIRKAIKKAKKETNKPSLIILKSIIGYGSPMAGNHKCHGAPLGEENIAKMKADMNWTCDPFEVPEEVKEVAKKAISKGKRAENKWKRLVKEYKAQFPAEYAEFDKWLSGKTEDLVNVDSLWQWEKADATRNTSGIMINRLAQIVPNLIGGSADLAPSNMSYMKERGDFSVENRTGANLHFGIREHAMAAICNGMTLHGGLKVYCATFFVFCDYMKNAMRMSALMNIPVTYVLTHDSIGVGEDGPTHEPVEQLISLRSIPNMKVFRPADGNETTAAWISAVTGQGPTALVLTRQNLPQYGEMSAKNALKGGYVISDCEGEPDVLLMASGSEVELILKAQEELKTRGIEARCVSMPCMEIFEAQDEEYKESVIPSYTRARVAVEAGSAYSWYKYVGLDGEMVTMDTFGASAPAKVLFEHYGFTVDNVVEKAFMAIENNLCLEDACFGCECEEDCDNCPCEDDCDTCACADEHAAEACGCCDCNCEDCE